VAPFTGRWWITGFCTALATVTTLWVARRRAHVDPRAVAVAAGVVLAVAVVLPPSGSHDLWSYAMVGRTVSAHHANPYVTPPGTFPTDPILPGVARGWRHTTTPYGPVFVAYAAGVAGLAGPHPLLERWGFQLGAALAVALALWLLWSAIGMSSALVLLALHPVVSATIVNGGHNDAFVGLAVLAAVLLARADRFGAAGWTLAAGALVKLPAGLAVLPLAAWAWKRRGTRAAIEVSAPPLALAFVSNAFVPGALHSVASADAGVVSRGSVWNLALQARTWFAASWGGRDFAPLLTKGALVVVVLFALLAARQALDARTRVDGEVATATSAWLFAGAYTLPWYAGWSLPVAALQPASPLTALIFVQAGFLAASGTIPRAVMSRHAALGAFVHLVVPAVLLVAFLVAVLGTDRPACGQSLRSRRPTKGVIAIS
jgi:hypothetical protein